MGLPTFDCALALAFQEARATDLELGIVGVHCTRLIINWRTSSREMSSVNRPCASKCSAARGIITSGLVRGVHAEDHKDLPEMILRAGPPYLMIQPYRHSPPRLSKAHCPESNLGEYEQFVTSRRLPKAFLAVPLSGFCGLGRSLEPMPIGVIAELVPIGFGKVHTVILRGLFNVDKR